MTIEEILNELDQYIDDKRKFVRDTNMKNMYNIGVGYESALSGVSNKVQSIRKRVQKELEEIIDGD